MKAEITMMLKVLGLTVVSTMVLPATAQVQLADGSVEESEILVSDRFGNKVPLREIAVHSNGMQMRGGGTSCTAGWFNLQFTDVDNGFNDPTWGTVYRNIACQVFSDLSVLIEPANDPYTLTPPQAGLVNMELRLPTDPQPGAVGMGSSYFGHVNGDPTTPETYRNRVLDGEVWKTINGGFDSWFAQTFVLGPGSAFHGYVYIDFDQYPSTAWHLNGTTPPGAPVLDLYTVLFHEALHAMGVSSFIDADGSSVIFSPSVYYSRWDMLLQSSGNDIIDDQWVCNSHFYSGTALNSNCSATFNGANGVQPVYSPNAFASGSSYSHLDGNCPGGLNYLMHPGPISMQSRIPLQEEAFVLCDIGYKTTSSVGTDISWQGRW